MPSQPACAADALDGRGEGFVEHRVVGDIQLLVRQLVEDQPRQLAFAAVDEGVEQRIAAGTLTSSR